MTAGAAVPCGVAEADGRDWPEGPERQYCGHVIIEWPAPLRKDGHPGAMAAWACSIFDAETGKPIVTAEKIAIPAVTAEVRSFITCDLAMFADDKGMPVLFPDEHPDFPGSCIVHVDGKDKIRKGVFPFLVAEMRVRGS